jgi:isopentenyldiphosphate isomerase
MTELFEALDENAQPTGELKTKQQILDDGDWRNVVHVWVVNSQQEILAQKRAAKGLWDNLWDVTVGGGVSAHEDSAHAAVRELDEELGIVTNESEIQKLGVWETTKPLPEQEIIAREFSHTYLLRKDIAITTLKPSPREVVAVLRKPLAKMLVEIEDDELYKNWVPHPREYYLGVIALIERTYEEN